MSGGIQAAGTAWLALSCFFNFRFRRRKNRSAPRRAIPAAPPTATPTMAPVDKICECSSSSARTSAASAVMLAEAAGAMVSPNCRPYLDAFANSICALTLVSLLALMAPWSDSQPRSKLLFQPCAIIPACPSHNSSQALRSRRISGRYCLSQSSSRLAARHQDQ